MQAANIPQALEKYRQGYAKVGSLVIGVGLDSECIEMERQQCDAVLVKLPNESYDESHRLIGVRDVTEYGVVVESECIERIER